MSSDSPQEQEPKPAADVDFSDLSEGAIDAALADAIRADLKLGAAIEDSRAAHGSLEEKK